MPTDLLAEDPLSEIAANYKSAECSPVELVDAVLDRIEKSQPAPPMPL